MKPGALPSHVLTNITHYGVAIRQSWTQAGAPLLIEWPKLNGRESLQTLRLAAE